MPSASASRPIEHFATLFDNNFLPMGLCLHQSLMEHGQPFCLWILCMDELVERNLAQLSLPGVRLIPLREVEDARLLAVKPLRSRGEYCWTLTPFIPQFIFERHSGANRVTYLDADLFFFASPDPFFEEFEQSGKAVLITEHAYGPRYAAKARRSGRFCVQFISFVRSVDAARVMGWWQDRCLKWCYARVENGKYGDQKYLDNWPALFEREVHILQQKNRTLAPWNVRYYQGLEGNEAVPVFFHFHGLRLIGPSRLLLYSGYDVGKEAERFYGPYRRTFEAGLESLGRNDIPIPLLPLSSDLMSRLLRWKRRVWNGEEYASLSAAHHAGRRLPFVSGTRISVVTVSFNSAATIGDTLRSVASQKNIAAEHLVIDGGSTDGTVAIVEKFSGIAYFVSEPDRGLYDAMNKGIKAATGEYVGFLNSDDIYEDDRVLERIAHALDSGSWDSAHGDLVYVSQADPGKVLRYWKSKPYTPGMFEAGWHPAHPTLFVRRSVLLEMGGFDTGYRFHADFDLMVRLFIARRISSTYLPEVLVRMRTGGQSNRSIRNIYRGNRESYVIARQFGVATSPLWIPRKLGFRVAQYFKRPPRN
jgi:GT2 family glycosyltransferase